MRGFKLLVLRPLSARFDVNCDRRLTGPRADSPWLAARSAILTRSNMSDVASRTLVIVRRIVQVSTSRQSRHRRKAVRLAQANRANGPSMIRMTFPYSYVTRSAREHITAARTFLAHDNSASSQIAENGIQKFRRDIARLGDFPPFITAPGGRVARQTRALRQYFPFAVNILWLWLRSLARAT
jgi:hypothetical protein